VRDICNVSATRLRAARRHSVRRSAQLGGLDRCAGVFIRCGGACQRLSSTASEAIRSRTMCKRDTRPLRARQRGQFSAIKSIGRTPSDNPQLAHFKYKAYPFETSLALPSHASYP
jgi:hypothetical protein